MLVANRFRWEDRQHGDDGQTGRFERTLCGVAFAEVDGVAYRGFQPQRGGPHPVSAGDPLGAGCRGAVAGATIDLEFCRRRDDPARTLSAIRVPCPRFRRAVADAMAARPPAATMTRNEDAPTAAVPSAPATKPLIMALPNGRILGEVMPLLRRVGIEPEPAFTDPNARQLRFRTSDPGST